MAACTHAADPAEPTIETVPVRRQNIVVDVEATGIIQPINTVEIRSKASGQIMEMPVQTGSQVKPGDLLVQIDPRDVQNRYDQAVVSLNAATAAFNVDSLQLLRQQSLFKGGVITRPELESAQLAYANAKSQLTNATTNKAIAEINLEDATVRAPVAGTIIQKNASLGQVITSSTSSFGGGTVLLLMANLGKVIDSTLVGEIDIGRVQPGQTATVTVDAYPNRTFTGTVQKIAPQATVVQSVTMFPVLIALDNADGALMPGMNSDVSVLVERQENVLAVPNDAVRSPRDAMAAATALGLDPATVRSAMSSQMGGGRGGRSRGRGRGADAARTSASTGDVAAGMQIAQSGAQNGQAGRRSGMRRGQRYGAAGQDSTGMQRGRRGADAGMTSGAEGSMPSGTRPHAGLVFLAQNGTFVPKVIMLGAGNYDVTQVISGLKEGDQVALITAAMLQQARDQQLQRIRSRTGLPGMRSDTQNDSTNNSQRGGRRGGRGA
jgi:HlyD family secretion protein